jgi:hypothetical protein
VFVVPVVKVVVPHPLTVTPPRVEKLNVGRTRSILSAAFRGALSANVNVTDVGASVTELPIFKLLFSNAGVAAVTAVDDVTAVEMAMLVASAIVTPTVRLESSAPCAAGLVVTPVAIVTVHRVPASTVADPAVSVTVAVAVPELLTALVNVVLPHPLVLSPVNVASVNVGSTNAIWSAAFNGAFNSNEYDIDDAAETVGFAIVKLL